MTGRTTPPKGPAQGTRKDRLKVALKANMARRKAQARARADTDNGKTAGETQAPDKSEGN
ncbi:hypothetical protein FLO80_09310 [Aquicoccus porphyridii]|uniref:Uncharacterized protein n=1 Tax=Aquicoccus porphyridii TaxID=1852029 RepID=A0A5A9ZGY0_9RHOB|nr:hypothetical protein [Aquicoccus porphyridii]KAA0916299.1 hypothetical protein FLO80_09310 [Aquicoccus porphyridii]RAI53574.1 hypothetical protein DOO74_12210 [Rhodobacteraceae bacterium AsT-22]